MAMTKAEKAFVQTLRERAALTLPPYQDPVPMDLSSESRGYRVVWFMNGYTGRVTKGWSDGFIHNPQGEIPTDDRNRSASQGKGRGYLTKLNAYHALRWETTRRVMAQLAVLDAQIELLEAEDEA